MKEKAYAKINLCLDVVGKREDGYHDLRMVMVPINYYDILDIEFAEETTLSVNKWYLPSDQNNTVISAINIMRERYGFTQQFKCELSKHIPTQAGLAGGSADGAAAIRILNKMLKLNMSTEEMIDVARQVGSDVPFCILNKPAIVTGIGEKIETFECETDFKILLVKPRRGVSTKAAFEALDYEHMVHPDVQAMKDALVNQNYDKMIENLGNSLEKVSMKLVRDIRFIKEDLLGFGFDGALMSGSGSTVFGITKSPKRLQKGADLLKYKGFFVRITSVLETGENNEV